MRWLAAASAVLALGLHHPLWAQGSSDSTPVPVRIATVTAGLGNSMGWFGLQGERYFATDRLSAFVGLGYTPSVDEGDPSGITFAAGFRGFTPGIKHRGFLEASVCQIYTYNDFVSESTRLYGPCLQAGYQFASRGGFTILVSGGLGYAPGVPEGENEIGGLLSLGFGYTWRR